MNAAKAKALELLAVSRETLTRIEQFETLLRKWQHHVNLVSPQALDELWWRHIADSAQLLRHAPPTARTWADIGSGAGFPGAIIGIILADRPGARVHLIESDQKKCAFLLAVSRETGAPLQVHCERAETALRALGNVDVVTSRAVAKLPALLDWCDGCLTAGALGLFLKGRNYQLELTGYAAPASVKLSSVPSLTDPEAAIVIAQAQRDPRGI